MLVPASGFHPVSTHVHDEIRMNQLKVDIEKALKHRDYRSEAHAWRQYHPLKNSQMQEKISFWETRAKTLETALERLERSSAEDLRRCRFKWEEYSVRIEREEREVRKDKIELQKQLEKCKNEINELKGNLEHADEVNSENDRLSFESNQLRLQMQTLQQELSQSKANAASQQEIEALRGENEELKAESAREKRKAEGLEEQNEQYRSQLEPALKKMRECINNNDSLKMELDKAKTEYSSLKATHEGTKTRHKTAQEEKNAKIAELQQQVQTQRLAHAAAQEALQTEAKKEKRRADQLEAEVQNATSAIKRYKELFDQFQQQITAFAPAGK